MVRRIIVFIAIIISALGAYAQQGLHVNEIFTGKAIITALSLLPRNSRARR